jgi:hypothetical protein
MKRTVQQKFGKRVFLSVMVVAGLISLNAKAQTWYGGVTAGAQYTTISSNFQNWNGGIGYNAKISAELRPSQHFGIEIQFGIGTLSASTSYHDSIKYYDYVERFQNNYTLNSNFMQGHLLFKYYVRLGGEPITPYDRPQGSGNYLYFFGGPYMGLNQSIGRTGTQTQKKHINFTTPWDSSSDTYTKILNNNGTQADSDRDIIFTAPDLGITLGAGISLRLSSAANLDFSLNYTRGLVTFDNNILDGNHQDFTRYAFMLGHASIESSSTGTTRQIDYTAAQAFTNFIALNVGLKFRIFGDAY